jgi:phasin family protein
MNMTPDQILAAGKGNMETLFSLATTQFSVMEKLAELNAAALKAAFEASMSNARAMAGAKDMQELMQTHKSLPQPAVEKAMAYSQGVYELVRQSNTELQKIAEGHVAEWNANLAALLDQARKNAPEGSHVALDAMKQVLAGTSTAYASFSKIAKQATEMAEANVANATASAKAMAGPKKSG